MSEQNEPSILDRALRRARAERDRRVDVSVESVGLVLHCRIPADSAEIERLKANAERIEKGRVANTHLNRSVVALCVESIDIDGEPLTDASGEPLNFRDPQLWRMLGADVESSKDAVVALLASDGHIARVANRLLSEAGYTEDPFD